MEGAGGERTFPLSRFLHPDGTLDLPPEGIEGSLDTTGYRLASGPRGTPRFEPDVRAPERDAARGREGGLCWDERFAWNGGGPLAWGGGALYTGWSSYDGSAWRSLGVEPEKVIYCAAWDGRNLYIGGMFDEVAGVGANYVAKWDGSAWSPLGSGVNSTVSALAWDGTNLYAGGAFTAAGGAQANYVARWDGSSWHALGSGMNSSVLALLWSGGQLYAGGLFTRAGGASANRIARWDGVSWAPLASGLGSTSNDQVWTLASDGVSIYAGGYFKVAGGVEANMVARWDGATWRPLGSGMNYTVYALAFGGGHLYAGGSFFRAGGVEAENIARWDGTAWSGLGEKLALHLGPGTDAEVTSLAWDGTGLYLSGRMWVAGGTVVHGICRWDGSNFAPVGRKEGLSHEVFALAACGDGMCAVGAFQVAGGVLPNGVARWDGTAWCELGESIRSESGWFLSLAWDGTNLYAGEIIALGSGRYDGRVLRWDGTSWSELGYMAGGGTGGGVYALAWDGRNLFAGGGFSHVGDAQVRNIARWDGTTWSPLGAGREGRVEALLWNGAALCAGESLLSSSGVPHAGRVSRWDGAGWTELGATDSSVHALAWDGSNLYAGGRFWFVGDLACGRIARWDGSAWSPMGTEFVNSTVRALAWDGGRLLAGGYGLGYRGFVVRWDGSSWDSSGVEFDREVYALAPEETGLFVGGAFTRVGATESSHFATWTRPASITVQPADLSLCAGTDASFAVSAEGEGLAYRWQADAGAGFADLTDGEFISGATAPSLHLRGVAAQMDGLKFRCLVTGACGPTATSGTATLSLLARGATPAGAARTMPYGAAGRPEAAACAAECAPEGPQEGIVGTPLAFLGGYALQGCTGCPEFEWDFGDGSPPSSIQNPKHTYASAGTYAWTFRLAAGGADCTGGGTVTVAHPCSVACAAEVSASGSTRYSVPFSGVAAADHCAAPPTVDWDFGDGSDHSSEPNPLHHYWSAGDYEWTLTVSADDAVCIRSGRITISQEAPCDLSGFGAAPESGRAGEALPFEGLVTTTCGEPLSLLWDFGDGSAGSTEMNPYHAYMEPGSYAWTLTAAAGGAARRWDGTILIGDGAPGECDGDGQVSIGEVQRAINMFLGDQSISCGVDCSGDGTVSIGEVQKVINGFLGMSVTCFSAG